MSTIIFPAHFFGHIPIMSYDFNSGHLFFLAYLNCTYPTILDSILLFILQAAGAAEAGISSRWPETRSEDRIFQSYHFLRFNPARDTEPLQGSV